MLSFLDSCDDAGCRGEVPVEFAVRHEGGVRVLQHLLDTTHHPPQLSPAWIMKQETK